MILPQSPTLMTWLMWGPVCLEAALTKLLGLIAAWLEKAEEQLEPTIKRLEPILTACGLFYFSGVVAAAVGMDILYDTLNPKPTRRPHAHSAR